MGLYGLCGSPRVLREIRPDRQAAIDYHRRTRDPLGFVARQVQDH
jgi:hypothetical protein